MPVLTDLASAAVKRGVRTLYGKVLTRPELLVSDGLNAIYACDVEIGVTDPTGRIYQYNDPDNEDGGVIGHLPGQDDWTLDDSLVYNTILHNVTIARNNADLIYADVGSAVTLTRSASGQWQITGFAIEQPGTYHLIGVDLDAMTILSIKDLSIDTRLLTLGELGTFAAFGVLPFGASGIFIGGALRQIV